MKLRKITLVNISDGELAKKEKAQIVGGKSCGCVGSCIASCGCRYGTTTLPDDFMGVDAHLNMYDSLADPIADGIMDPLAQATLNNQ